MSGDRGLNCIPRAHACPPWRTVGDRGSLKVGRIEPVVGRQPLYAKAKNIKAFRQSRSDERRETEINLVGMGQTNIGDNLAGPEGQIVEILGAVNAGSQTPWFNPPDKKENLLITIERCVYCLYQPFLVLFL